MSLPLILVTAALFVSPTTSQGAPNTQANIGFEQLLASADRLAMTGDHGAAVAAYEQAFSAMPPELRTTEVGELVVIAAAEVALDAHDSKGALELLVRGRTLLCEYIDQVSSQPEYSPEALETSHAMLARIDALLPSTDESPPEPQIVAEASVETPSGGAQRDLEARAPPIRFSERAERSASPPIDSTRKTVDMPPPRIRRSSRFAAYLLTISGGSLTAGGIALIIAGSRQIPWFEQEMQEIGWVTAHPDYGTELARAERMRTIDIGIGVGLGVIGGALVAAGTTLLLRRSKRSRRSLTRDCCSIHIAF